MEELSAFRKVFGDSPVVRVLDFLIGERSLYDYSLTEIAENAGVSWATLHKIWPVFILNNFVVHTRTVGRAKLFRLNENNPVIKELVALDARLNAHFARKKVAKQRKRSLAAC